jgi:hypothetical protein
MDRRPPPFRVAPFLALARDRGFLVTEVTPPKPAARAWLVHPRKRDFWRDRLLVAWIPGENGGATRFLLSRPLTRSQKPFHPVSRRYAFTTLAGLRA